jgi:hypothetical protein
VRLAVDAAWRWLGETGERVTAAGAELPLLVVRPRRPAPPAQRTEPEGELLPQARSADEPPHSPARPVADEPVQPERFDAALSRLREQIESDPGRPV